MSRETVGTALNAMADPEVCEKLAAGDLSVLGDLEFDDKERDAVIEAANDYPDVAGHAFGFASFNFAAPPPSTLNLAGLGRFGAAAHYAYGVNAGPVLSAHEAL